MTRHILIAIDDDYYRDIMNAKALNEGLLELEEAVADGELLSIGHGKIMDEKEFCRNLRKYYRHDLTPINKALADTTAIIEASKEEE